MLKSTNSNNTPKRTPKMETVAAKFHRPGRTRPDSRTEKPLSDRNTMI